MDEFGVISPSFLELIGTSPFAAMWFLFWHGGFLLVLAVLGWAAVHIWVETKQGQFSAKKQWILLAIDIPRMTEQTPRAVENIFAHLAGAHGPPSWVEKWIIGRTQDTITMEIVSIEGHVQFLIHTTRGFRDLIEASIYAQYPDAEIVEVEDYTLKIPHHYPDREWDVFGTEFIPVKSDVYPLRTYPEFEDKVSGEFKDPLAVLLENMSRLGPGEQVWYQIVLTPIEQFAFREKGEAMVKKLTGQKVEHHPGMLEQIFMFPITLIGFVLEGLGIGGGHSETKKEKSPFDNAVLRMTPGERKVLEALENKISKIAYLCKVRFLYVAKKEILKKSRIVHPLIGAIKQFNTNDMQSLKPEGKKVGMNPTLWFFKISRNEYRKNKLIKAYTKRSNWAGMPGFHMNIEELASLWHFPITMQTRAPQLKKTESKKAEPPMNLPFG